MSEISNKFNLKWSWSYFLFQGKFFILHKLWAALFFYIVWLTSIAIYIFSFFFSNIGLSIDLLLGSILSILIVFTAFGIFGSQWNRSLLETRNRTRGK